MIKNVGHLCLIQDKLSALLVTAQLVEHVNNLREFWSHIILNLVYWARIFKCLWGPGIDSKEWIPSAYVA